MMSIGNVIRKIIRNFVPYRISQKLLSLLLTAYSDGGGISENEIKTISYLQKRLLREYPAIKYVLFDVGANIGNYSLDLIQQFGRSAEVHAFEPLSSTYEMLTDNIQPYGNVFCHNIGLGSEIKVMPVYTNKAGSGLTSVYKRRLDHFDIDMNIKQDCSFSTVDEFCRSNDIMHILFLKIDVEGHELAVLQGAKKMMSEDAIDFIQFEFGGCNIDSRTFFQDFWYMLNDKYSIYRITPSGLYPILHYNELTEIFIFTNYLAELKNLKKQ